MKKLLTICFAVVFALSSSLAFAAPGRKGSSDKAMENASDEAVFNRVGDWFATIGKSGEEKEAIIAERKAERAAKKAQKEAKKKQKMAEKKAKEAKGKAKGKFK